MSTVEKSAQYCCRAFISINGRQITYKYIIATNSFMFHVLIVSQSSDYTMWKRIILCYTYMIVNKM